MEEDDGNFIDWHQKHNIKIKAKTSRHFNSPQWQESCRVYDKNRGNSSRDEASSKMQPKLQNDHLGDHRRFRSSVPTYRPPKDRLLIPTESQLREKEILPPVTVPDFVDGSGIGLDTISYLRERKGAKRAVRYLKLQDAAQNKSGYFIFGNNGEGGSFRVDPFCKDVSFKGDAAAAAATNRLDQPHLKNNNQTLHDGMVSPVPLPPIIAGNSVVGRQDAIVLAATLDKLLHDREQAFGIAANDDTLWIRDAQGNIDVEKALIDDIAIWDTVFSETAKQVQFHCSERGTLLVRMGNHHKLLVQKCAKAITALQEKNANQEREFHESLEIASTMKSENETLTSQRKQLEDKVAFLTHTAATSNEESEKYRQWIEELQEILSLMKTERKGLEHRLSIAKETVILLQKQIGLEKMLHETLASNMEELLKQISTVLDLGRSLGSPFVHSLQSPMTMPSTPMTPSQVLPQSPRLPGFFFTELMEPETPSRISSSARSRRRESVSVTNNNCSSEINALITAAIKQSLQQREAANAIYQHGVATIVHNSSQEVKEILVLSENSANSSERIRIVELDASHLLSSPNPALKEAIKSQAEKERDIEMQTDTFSFEIEYISDLGELVDEEEDETEEQKSRVCSNDEEQEDDDHSTIKDFSEMVKIRAVKMRNSIRSMPNNKMLQRSETVLNLLQQRVDARAFVSQGNFSQDLKRFLVLVPSNHRIRIKSPRWLNRRFWDIIDEKKKADAFNKKYRKVVDADYTRQPLAEFVFQYFLKLYGAPNLAAIHFSNLLGTIRKHAETFQLAILFGRVLGCIQDAWDAPGHQAFLVDLITEMETNPSCVKEYETLYTEIPGHEGRCITEHCALFMHQILDAKGTISPLPQPEKFIRKSCLDLAALNRPRYNNLGINFVPVDVFLLSMLRQWKRKDMEVSWVVPSCLKFDPASIASLSLDAFSEKVLQLDPSASEQEILDLYCRAAETGAGVVNADAFQYTLLTHMHKRHLQAFNSPSPWTRFQLLRRGSRPVTCGNVRQENTLVWDTTLEDGFSFKKSLWKPSEARRRQFLQALNEGDLSSVRQKAEVVARDLKVFEAEMKKSGESKAAKRIPEFLRIMQSILQLFERVEEFHAREAARAEGATLLSTTGNWISQESIRALKE